MTDILYMLLIVGIPAGIGLLYGEYRYRAGWNAGHINGLEYARKHINLIGREK